MLIFGPLPKVTFFFDKDLITLLRVMCNPLTFREPTHVVK